MSSIRSVLIFLTFTLIVSLSAQAQDQDPALAREFMTQAELTLESTQAVDIARDLYINAANYDTTFLKANFEAGKIHIETINRGQAVTYFLRVYRQDADYRFDLEYWIGKSYQYALEFDKAIDFYNRYKSKLAKKSNYQGKDRVSLTVVDRNIFECENGKEFISNPKNFSIVNIGREINSEFDDYGPVMNEAGTEIVFTTRRKDDNLNENVADDNKPWEDIFISTKAGDKWNYAKNIGAPVNGDTHDSNLALSADGKLLFKYSDDNGGDIHYCELQDNGTWSEPVALPGIINSTFEEKSITISRDEKTLYFMSNRPGGFGGTDLYKASKDSKGHWSNVKNLGPKINTDLDEDGPYINEFNNVITLYFSSKGHKGMGGYDIFRSTYDAAKNEWSDPINLGYPINTPDDDVYFITSPDGKIAYYSTVRDDGMGYQDIYMITVPEGLTNVEPTTTKKEPVVIPKDTTTVARVEPKKEPDPKKEPVEPKKEPVEPKKEPVVEPKKEPVQPKKEPVVQPKKELVPLRYVVNVIDAETKSPLSSARVKLIGAKDNVIVKGNATEGTYQFSVTSSNPKEYRLSVESDGYVFQNTNVKLAGAAQEEKIINRTIEMRKLAVGVTSILRNIYFDFNKATFKTESYAELNKLEAMLRSNSSVKLEIGGHTDGVGPNNYNIFLSRKRAEAVKDYLLKKGIDARRVKAVGYGKSKPLASNDDEDEGREFNRRVEFRVLQK
jgi:outer membrane protein OmpA-like peptidoglycan-associated protein